MDVKIEIGPQCTNKDCGQEFNSENFNLAVCLYGVFFLIGPEKGFLGFTCPKCLKTSSFEIKSNFISKIIEQLTSRVEVKKESLNENRERITEQVSSFEPDLRYYSQFMMDDEILKKFNIRHYGFSNLGENQDLSGQINNFINEELPDSKNHLCSYIEDSKHPAEGFTAIYWYREEDIESLLAYENNHNIRIFPRYHYYTDLVESIDSLLGSHYFMGKDFEKAKEDHEKENRATVETLKAYAREKNINFDNLVESIELDDPQALQKIIEENRQQKARDPKISGMFLDVLVSDPFPLKIISEGHCDYLWAEVDPFHDKDIPEYFADELEDERLKNKICEMRELHSKMVGQIQENFHKQYVQEFLKSDLIPFLEEYEIIARSKGIAYAEIWKLKESYLEELFKETNKGLRETVLNSFYFNSPGWTIKFNNQSVSGLRDIGLKYIHYLICNQNKEVSYFDLSRVDGIDTDFEDRVRQYGNEDKGHTSSESQKKVFGKNIKSFDVREMMDDKGSKELRQQKRKLEEALLEAEKDNDPVEIEKAKQELDEFETHLMEYYVPFIGKKRRFSAKENKDLCRRIELALSRAIEKIKDNNKELYWHFAQSIYGLPRVFYKTAGTKYLFLENFEVMYKPDPNIEWHLD